MATSDGYPPTGKGKTIILNADEIRKRATEIATWGDPYDVYIWLWAEAELRLTNAYITHIGDHPGKVVVDPDKIVDKPPGSKVRELALNLSIGAHSVQDIHWFIAELQIIYEKALKQEKTNYVGLFLR